ncbi:MAG TPA: DNA glycosylase [Candidatus Woesearchaeota archaeon]|nr:DNA glycosylase [Candidatus Woesearchaeota archaeon]
MRKIKAPLFDLKKTLECGQFFNYFEEDGVFFVVDGSNFFIIKQQGQHLYFDGNITEEFLINFFSLDLDYKNMLKEISKDKIIESAIHRSLGLRIINQDLFQCMISFICSSASNVPKIKRNILSISKSFGNPVTFKDKQLFLFPLPKQISDLELIKQSSAGFRSKYIYQCSQIATKELLDKIKKTDYSDAKKILMSFNGIGDKVSECICLFSLKFYDAFPVDVWIKRETERLYFKNEIKSKEFITSFFKEYFGHYAGYAQEFLFYSARNEQKPKK